MPPKEVAQLIETRTISGRGVFQFAPDPVWRHFWLYVGIIRLPSTDYGSSQYNPDRSFYATFNWSRKDYLLREDILRYEQQCFQWSPDPTAYIAQAETCLHSQTWEYIQQIGSLMGIVYQPPNPDDTIWYEPLDEHFDRIRIVCRGETAIQCQLWGLKKDVSCPDAAPSSKLPPDPLPPPLQYPPDFPLGDTPDAATPPYEDNDNGDTVPLPGDVYEEPPSQFPAGDACQVVRVRLQWTQNSDNQVITLIQNYFGPVLGVRFRQKPSPAPIQYIEVESRGRSFGSLKCQPTSQWVVHNSAGGTDIWSDLVVLEVTPL